MRNLQKVLTKQQKQLNVIYVTSYIPRKCGVATYTKDLTNAINLLNSHSLAEIMAVTREDEEIEYPWETKFKLHRDDLSTYLAAAQYINDSHADVISLQHEFGLFGGESGEYIVPLVEAIERPLVTTLHTVLANPAPKQMEIIKRLTARSQAVVVMMSDVAEKLVKVYKVPRRKIVVIPHGVPDFVFNDTERYKRKRKLSGRLVLGNINLLAPNKGIEYALEAVAQIAQRHPEVLYLVIGETHPEIKRHSGETYRNYLRRLTRQLGITKNVRFINRYLSLDDLIGWLKTIDIYITPYLEMQQVTSGALAYAIGAGKPCVSTPYIYAKEVLADGRGILVPERDAEAIAQSALDLWENREKLDGLKRRAYAFGRLMTWPNVAQRMLNLMRAVEENGNARRPVEFSRQLAGTPQHTRQPSGQ